MTRRENVQRFIEYFQKNQSQTLTPSALRAWFTSVMKQNPVPPDAKLEPSNASVPASWITPPGVDPTKVILYIHGGGHLMGSPETHLETIFRFATASGTRALAVDYRLAPENAWPAGLLDCLEVYRWLLREGFKPSQIAIAGDSAGGGLTLATLQALRDAGETLPACAVLCSPWLDFTASGESCKTNAGGDPMIDPASLPLIVGAVLQGQDPATHSPLFGDVSRLPPLFVQVGGAEVLLDDSRRLVEKTANNDVLDVWEDMVHGFQAFPVFFPEAITAVERAGAFVKGQLG